MDSREHKERRKYAERRFKAWGMDYEIKQLPYGDYVCGNTVIEWKTTIDFIQSILDGRLKKETIDQANNFPYHFVFVVGSVDVACYTVKKYTRVKDFHKTRFFSAMASLLTYTNVVTFKDEKEAFQCMRYVFEKCNDTNRRIVRPVEKLSRNPCYNFLIGIPRISQKRAENIVALHNLKTLKDLLKMNKKKLLAVDGIGESLADEILQALGKKVN
jgi:ERCC4-type nuclease